MPGGNRGRMRSAVFLAAVMLYQPMGVECEGETRSADWLAAVYLGGAPVSESLGVSV